jgi:hypothetical protein
MNGRRALELIHRTGVETLGGFDGCLCTKFTVQGVNVEIYCTRSGNLNIIEPGFQGITIRVYSSHVDSDARQLRLIAWEVAQQIRDVQGDAIAVRYCDYQHDLEWQCNRCGGIRESQAGYLCTVCLLCETDPGQFDFRMEPAF